MLRNDSPSKDYRHLWVNSLLVVSTVMSYCRAPSMSASPAHFTFTALDCTITARVPHPSPWAAL